ncbi:MAG: efflux RND transporter permease subunit [Thermodesulfobacteriota bacterium]|nr:efflux RND transporter permease subunit [Thermodesulfobacteriota bacterium]
MIKQIVDFSFRYWKWVVCASVLLTLVSAYYITQIRIDNSIESMAIDDDPSLASLQHLESTFGGNEFIVIAFKGDDIFSPRVLSMIDAITTNIEQIENVEWVLSLTNALVAQKNEYGIGMDALVPESDRSGNDVQALKQKVMSQKIYEKLLFSSTGDATAIIAWLSPLGADDAARWRAVSAIKRVIKTHKDDRKVYVYGMPVYQEILYKIMIEDQLILPSIICLLMGGLFFLIFKDLRIVVLPFIVIGLSILWAMGFFVMGGNTLDVVTFVIPSVLLIVCLCAAIHILSAFRDAYTKDTDRVDTVKRTVSHIGIPVMLTSLTTAVGFLSLTACSMKSIRTFGIYAGLGVIFAFLTSITVLPLLMALLPLKKKPKNDGTVLETSLGRLAGWILRHKRSVAVGTIIVMAVCVPGALKVDSKMVILGMFKKNVAKDIVDAHHFIDVEMAGSCEFEVLLKGDRPGAMLEQDVLETIDRTQHRMLETCCILKTLSIVDYLKLMNQVLNDNDPAFYRIPDSRQKIDSIMMLYAMNEEAARLNTIINDDYSEARIRLFSLTGDSSEVLRLMINQGKAIINEEFAGMDVTATFTSQMDVWGNMVEALTAQMTKTFSLAFVLIFAMMFLLFRTWKLGLISSVVNVVPIIAAFGYMGWFNIDMNMATAMMPSIAIGISVDATIHFIWRFEKEFLRHQNYPDAFIHTMKTVGKPITITTVLICVGFSVLFFARLTVFTEFGLLLSLTVAAAFMADVFVAPILIFILKPFKTATGDPCIDLEIPQKEMAAEQVRVSKNR